LISNISSGCWTIIETTMLIHSYIFPQLLQVEARVNTAI